MKRFSPDGKTVFALDRLTNLVLRTIPKNLVVEKEFNTVINRDGKKERWAEARLAEVDNAAKLAMEKLDSDADLSREERWALSFFIGFAESRGKGFREEAKESGFHDEYNREIAGSVGSSIPLDPVTKKRLEDAFLAASGIWVDAATLVRMAREEMSLIAEGGANIAATTSMGFELSGQVFQSNWVLGISQPDSLFITSDRPIGLWRPQRGPARTPKEQGIFKIFPISPTRALLMFDPVRSPILLHQTLDGKVVRLLNAAVVTRSHRYIIGSSESILRLSVADSRRLPLDKSDDSQLL